MTLWTSPTAIQDPAGNAANLTGAAADLKSNLNSTTTTATSITISGTQQVELFGPSSVNVTFASGAAGTLLLDASSQFTGTIAGLNHAFPYDTIDLADIAFGSNTTLDYSGDTSGGTLTVSDGTHTAKIAVVGQIFARRLQNSERRSRWDRGGRSIDRCPPDVGLLE